MGDDNQAVAPDPKLHDYWQRAAASYANQTSPLLPIAEDADSYLSFLQLTDGAPVSVLILGVTPALYHLPWPAGSEVLAIDQSADMIGGVWPGDPAGAFEGDWRCLPFDDGRFDYVVCDGGFVMMSPSKVTQDLVPEVARVLRPTGRFVTRVFLAASDDPLVDVFADVAAALIPSVNVLKLRLWSCLQRSAEEGVAVRDVYDAIIDRWNDLDEVQRVTALPREQFMPLAATATATNQYYLPMREQLQDIVCDGGAFTPLGSAVATYPLADRCPVLGFVRGGPAATAVTSV
jgi:SAM-dependent methyltransferase